MQKPRIETKKNIVTKMQRLVVSKWFYYGLIAILLVIIFFAVSYASSFNNDFAIRFMPTLIGIAFNFFILIVFFDLREELEWKTTRKKIMNRIGRQLYGVFQDVSSLCEVGVRFDFEKGDYKKYDEKKLQALTTKEITINDAWEKEETSRYYAQMFQGLEDALGEIERRHGNHISPYLQNSLINLEEYLHSLSFECLLTFGNKEDRKMFIVDAVGKTMKEIDEMRKNGIDVGF